MVEGLDPVEPGKELSERPRRPSPDVDPSVNERVITIVEAGLLALVAVLAAWSGYAATRWSSEASLALAQAAAARTEANRTNLDAMEDRNFDAATFDSWFTAYILDDQPAMEVAEARFRPQFRVAFDAWQATSPETSSDAPPDPTFMDEYEEPGLARAVELDAQADAHYQDGSDATNATDDYVRTTIFFASVLFLAGISRHFWLRAARYTLVGTAVLILLFAVTRLLALPAPPP